MLAQLFSNLNPLIPQTSNDNKGMNEVASDKNCVPYPPGCKRPIARFACLHMTSSSALLFLSLSFSSYEPRFSDSRKNRIKARASERAGDSRSLAPQRERRIVCRHFRDRRRRQSHCAPRPSAPLKNLRWVPAVAAEMMDVVQSQVGRLVGRRSPRASLPRSVRPPARPPVHLPEGGRRRRLPRTIAFADCLGALNGFHSPLASFDAVVHWFPVGRACSLAR